MDKNELISALKKGLRTEESSIAVYSHHITQASTRSNLTKEEVAKISKVLTGLKNESVRHKTIVSNLIKQVQEDPRNDI